MKIILPNPTPHINQVVITHLDTDTATLTIDVNISTKRITDCFNNDCYNANISTQLSETIKIVLEDILNNYKIN